MARDLTGHRQLDSARGQQHDREHSEKGGQRPVVVGAEDATRCEEEDVVERCCEDGRRGENGAALGSAQGAGWSCPVGGVQIEAKPTPHPRRCGHERSGAPVSSGDVKIASLETLTCDAGWRPWIFLKATTDDGLVGWAEIDSHVLPRGLAGIVEDLAPLVVGRDPRPGGSDLPGPLPRHPTEPWLPDRESARRHRERTPRPQGEGAFNWSTSCSAGPHESIPMYWSHCGTTRARAFEVTGTPKLDSYGAVPPHSVARSSMPVTARSRRTSSCRP